MMKNSKLVYRDNIPTLRVHYYIQRFKFYFCPLDNWITDIGQTCISFDAFVLLKKYILTVLLTMSKESSCSQALYTSLAASLVVPVHLS